MSKAYRSIYMSLIKFNYGPKQLLKFWEVVGYNKTGSRDLEAFKVLYRAVKGKGV